MTNAGLAMCAGAAFLSYLCPLDRHVPAFLVVYAAPGLLDAVRGTPGSGIAAFSLDWIANPSLHVALTPLIASSAVRRNETLPGRTHSMRKEISAWMP